VTVEITCVYN